VRRILITRPPRFRLYTSRRSYGRFAFDAVFGPPGREDFVARLEERLSEFLGVQHVVCTPMARSGLFLALEQLVQPGQEVVLSPYTIGDVVNMVLAAGAIPVFADIEADSLNLSPAAVEKAIGPHTGAVLATHLHGIAARTPALLAICRRAGVPLVEDAAQSFGAVQDGRRLGTLGAAGVYSFGTYKNVNGWYGGAVATHDPQLAAAMRRRLATWPEQQLRTLLRRAAMGLLTDVATQPWMFRWLTFPLFRAALLRDNALAARLARNEQAVERRDYVTAAPRGRMTGAQGRLVAAQLAHVDPAARARIVRATAYGEALAGLDAVRLPPPPEGMKNVYSYYPVRCADREGLLRWLVRHGHDVGAQHLHNCADLETFAPFHRDCPETRRAAAEVVLLPTYPRYPLAAVRRTAAAIRTYYRRQRN